jgi:hypothetical protein
VRAQKPMKRQSLWAAIVAMAQSPLRLPTPFLGLFTGAVATVHGPAKIIGIGVSAALAVSELQEASWRLTTILGCWPAPWGRWACFAGPSRRARKVYPLLRS